MIELFTPGPYEGPTPMEPRYCPGCGLDLMRQRHGETCPQSPRLDSIRRLALNPEERRLEDLLAACHRRAVKAWLRSGRSF